jgi:hypothetical protein
MPGQVTSNSAYMPAMWWPGPAAQLLVRVAAGTTTGVLLRLQAWHGIRTGVADLRAALDQN